MTSWITRRRPQPVPDYSAELIDAHKRIKAGQRQLRLLMVRLSVDRSFVDTDDYLDMALDVQRALDGRTG